MMFLQSTISRTLFVRQCCRLQLGSMMASATVTSPQVAEHIMCYNNNTIRMWSDATKKKKRPLKVSTAANNTKKKKPNKNLWQKGASGRITMMDHGFKRNRSMPKLCAGCGVEMISSSSRNNNNNNSSFYMAAGQDAVQSGGNTRTKRQEKMARYADVFDGDVAKRLCQRCQTLQSGNIMAAYDALKDVDAKVFTSQLAHVVSRRKFGLCIVVVDATDPEFTSVKKLRDAIKSTPAILVINKADLLPRPMNEYDVRYIKSRVENGRTKVIDAYAVSAQTGAGMVELAEGILSELAGKDIFIVGSANVGKSSLVKSLSSLLARTLRFKGKNKTTDDKRRLLLQNLNTTQSHLPGTTLQAVRIPCFPSLKHALWDTPGIINRASLSYSLFPSHIMEPLAYPSKIDVPTRENGRKVKVRKGYSVLIEAGWIDDGPNNKEAGSKVTAEEDDDDDDRWSDYDDKSSSYDDDEDGNNGSNEDTFTLARLDIVEDAGRAIEALAFIPACLNIRVVRTDNAPTTATVPEHYLKKVQKLVGDNYNNTDVSRPLTIFKGQHGEDGVVNFHAGEFAGSVGRGWIRRDVVFASLGWIMLSHRQSFRVKPWVVKESLWSKRRSLYPSNLEDFIEDEGYDNDDDSALTKYDPTMREDDPAFQDIKSRLMRASDKGRTQGGKKGGGKWRKEDDNQDEYERLDTAYHEW